MTTAVKKENYSAFVQAPAQTYTQPKLNERVSSSVQSSFHCKMSDENWNAEDAYKEGIRSLAQGQILSALKHFSLAINLHPDFPDALYMRASIYIQQQSLGAAVKDLKKIITQFEVNAGSFTAPLGPFELRVIEQLASLHLQMGNYPSAISCTLRGLHHDLKAINFLMLSARIYVGLGDIHSALKEVEKILTIQPGHHEATTLYSSLRMNKAQNATPSSPPISAPPMEFMEEAVPECGLQ